MLDSFIYTLNATLPIIIMVAIGYLCRRIGLITKDFAKAANKLVFSLFLPIMLFKNVYSMQKGDVGITSFIYCLIATVTVFLISIPLAILVTKRSERRGVLSQAVFRSNNALIGTALAAALVPSGGAAATSVISAAVIPVFNILGVVALSIFRPGSETDKNVSRGEAFLAQAKKIGIGILKNPLIWAIVIGLLALLLESGLGALGITFHIGSEESGGKLPFLWDTVVKLSQVATPLALVALGAQFEIGRIKDMWREITVGTLARCVVVPLLTLGVAYLFLKNHLNSAEFAAMIAIFATPVAVSTVPMAQGMGGDSELAGSLVVFTTLLSGITMFLGIFILTELGIFDPALLKV